MPRMLLLQMAQAFNVLSAQSAEFGMPGMNCRHSDVVIFRDVVDRVGPRFAQDLYYLPFRKLRSLHS